MGLNKSIYHTSKFGCLLQLRLVEKPTHPATHPSPGTLARSSRNRSADPRLQWSGLAHLRRLWTMTLGGVCTKHGRALKVLKKHIAHIGLRMAANSLRFFSVQRLHGFRQVVQHVWEHVAIGINWLIKSCVGRSCRVAAKVNWWRTDT